MLIHSGSYWSNAYSKPENICGWDVVDICDSSEPTMGVRGE